MKNKNKYSNSKPSKNNNIEINNDMIGKNYLNNFALFNKFDGGWNVFFNFINEYVQYYWESDTALKLIKFVQKNKTAFLIISFGICYLWSNYVLQILYHFMLIDSIVLSLLVLQNSSLIANSRRLSKNIILLALTSLNIIGGMITLFVVMFIYMEYSKFINRIAFKFLKFILKLVGNVFPPIYLLYPDIQLFNFDNPDQTLRPEIVLETELAQSSNKNSNKHSNKKKQTFKKLYFSTSSNTDYVHNSNSDSDYDSDSSTFSTSTSSQTDSSSSSSPSSKYKSISPTISKINNDILNKKIYNFKKMLNNK